MSTPVRVALIMDLEGGYNQSVVRGIADFVHTNPWMLRVISPHRVSFALLRDWEVMGIIASIGDYSTLDEAVAEGILALKRPWVNVVGIPGRPDVLFITNDDAAIGEEVAHHLLARGFRQFAYVGSDAVHLGERRTGFTRAVARQNYAVSLYLEQETVSASVSLSEALQTSWVQEDLRLQEWLLSLPLPVGIMAENDHWGWRVVQACRHCGLGVPGAVAVVGVDNTELLCDLCFPSLSSVEVAGQQIGFQAARWLHEMLSGMPPPASSLTFPPFQIVTRQSSDTLAVKDAVVAAALRFIRGTIEQVTDVETVARHVAVNRRTLERRFRTALGRTPYEEIHLARIEAAKHLLMKTDLTMPEIAARVGFQDARRLYDAFQKEMMLAPTRYRRSVRTDAGSIMPPFPSWRE